MTEAVLLARPAPGVVGEAARVCHIFRIPKGPDTPDRLTALCGASFGHGHLERLDNPAGMPCPLCLTNAPVSVSTLVSHDDSEADDLTARLEVIEHRVSDLVNQIAEIADQVRDLGATGQSGR